ncbi:PTS system, cellobiose-specific IIB component [Kosakonia arachidis]|uniref:PTS system, cellobiose-specific IIB component n=1 Tax=Kosakonia arachidis TaxID=551989 RepID=A0A1I6Z8W0_9ENTR|nr:PTS cellobiose transporter subunit IIB [Kosakonia arachidis]SFT59135.1 PTS system, cellobiose-specific IIB component [Kosakonia arachidis]
MKKLLICCLFGNTANALAKRMQKAAHEHNYPMLISAVGMDNFASVAPAFDCFLVAPHIQYKLDEIKAAVGDAPVAIIESYPFASMDGEKVLEFVMAKMPVLTE